MKKQTKKVKSPKTKMAVAMSKAVVVHNRRQRFWGIVALAGLFFCGFMLGTDVQHRRARISADNHVVNAEAAVPACEVIEDVLLKDLYPDGVVDHSDPNHNVDIYQKLIISGCSENKEKYEQLLQRELQITVALNQNLQQKPARNCLTIENLLKEQVRGLYDPNPYSHVENAKIYANLSERGCPENREKYVDLAKQELQIARALQDDQFYDNNETIEVVETYKRLNMQAAAEEIFEKAKKLTNPAIDFILQVEKIINE